MITCSTSASSRKIHAISRGQFDMDTLKMMSNITMGRVFSPCAYDSRFCCEVHSKS